MTDESFTSSDDENGPIIWRDPSGVVHTVAGYMEVPDRLRRLIESHLAVADWDDALSRADAIGHLVGEWQDEALEETTSANDIPDGPACEPADHEAHVPVVDHAVEAELRTARDDTALADRPDLLGAVGALVDEWQRYCLDDEKLLGHLIAAHGATDQARELAHEELFALHAAKHHQRSRRT